MVTTLERSLTYADRSQARGQSCASPVFFVGAKTWWVDAGSRVGEADRMRRPGRAALDAVAASQIIEAEKDGPGCQCCRIMVAGQKSPSAGSTSARS